MGLHVLTNDPRLIEALKFQGNYNPANTYTQNDVVVLAGVFYLSLVSSNTGNSPLLSYRQWAPFAGVPGAGATVGVGTTITGGVGTPAQVYNSGTPQNAVLNFTIPSGQGFRWRGPWQPNTAYAPYDVVTYGGSAYYVTTAYTSGANFDATNLALLAAGGAIVNSPTVDTIAITQSTNTFQLTQPPYDNMIVALFYGAGFQRQGSEIGQADTDYTVAGKTVNMSFQLNEGDTVTAVYFSANSASIPNLVVELMTMVSPTEYQTSQAPAQNFLWMCFYNGGFITPGEGNSYTFSGRTATLNFSTSSGDSLYAIYPPA